MSRYATDTENTIPGNEDEDVIVSRGQLKREMAALQELGRQLSELRPEQLLAIPMSDRLRSAMEEANRIRQHEARRRHFQYIGKIIRQEDTESLAQHVQSFSVGSQENTRRLHLTEHWRDQLIKEGDALVTKFLEEYPQADVQQLRNLVRSARKELQLKKNTGSSRKLFRFIRELMEAPASAN